MAPSNNDPGQFSPPTTGGDFNRSFPTYENCVVIGGGASAFNRSMLTSIGIDKPQFKDGAQGKPGNKRLNIQQYRCLLLTQRIPELGYRRVLDAPNYLDCRVEDPPNISVIINDAIREYGAGSNYTASSIMEILQELDEQMETNAEAKQALGPLATVINSLANFPQQGTPERGFLESNMELLLTTIDSLKAILKESFKAAGATIDNVVNIVLTFVDMLFFIGDYITEQRALRKELAARLLSQQRSIGLGDKPGVYGAYRITYGAGPSMQTIRAWCAAGVKRTPPDLYFFPDGSTSAYTDALNRWKATREIVTSATPTLEALFGNDYSQFFGVLFFLAAFRQVFTTAGDRNVNEFAYYVGTKGKDEDSILRVAVRRGSSLKTVVQLIIEPRPTDAAIGPVTYEEMIASTRVEAEKCNDTDYWVPFWEDTVFGNYNNSVNATVSAQTRKSLRRRLVNYMFTKWAQASDPKTCAWPNGSQKYVTYTGARLDAFAAKVIGVWDFLDAWAKLAYPSFGKTRRGKMIDQLISSKIDDLYTYGIAGVPPLARFDWPKAILFVMLPSNEVTAFGVTTKVDLGPEPKKSDYNGVKARCPGGVTDTTCLPCTVIKQRRPVGAKEITIPLKLRWSGNEGPLKSPEYALWAKNLRDAGYPEYYVDCYTQDLTFEAMPGATGGSTGSNRSGPLLGLMAPPIRGLRAPLVATLGARPAVPPLPGQKRLAAQRGALTVQERRQRGLLPPDKGGLGAAPSSPSSSASAGWIVGGLAVAGLAYLALRKK